jgi:spore maturation protein CgeB
MTLNAPLLKRFLDYPRLKAPPYRILLLESGYFTVAECKKGLEKLGHKVFMLPLGDDFIKRLLSLLVEVKPDFLLTINHLGFDVEGQLTSLLTELKLPFASWFVDSPTYILYKDERQVSDFCSLFSWERSYLPKMEEIGFNSPVFLPLATDPDTFRPVDFPAPSRLKANIAFVGNSMTEANHKWKKKIPPGSMRKFSSLALARQFAERRKTMREILGELGVDSEAGWFIDIEAAMVWKATQEYRQQLALRLLPLGLVIYGDIGWRSLLPGSQSLRPEVDYYRELPTVYNSTAINVNTTSFQMNSAVNQRVFDCAACGGFLLTDHQADMDLFFEPGKDSVCFESLEEAVELAGYYLTHEKERGLVAHAARKRVLSEHTYDRRMAALVSAMVGKFGSIKQPVLRALAGNLG